MSGTAVVALSAHGAALAGRLAVELSCETVLYLDRRFETQVSCGPEVEIRLFDLPLRPLLQRVWQDHAAVVLFLPVGAAVRLVAPLLQDKRSDPALVCVDDAGRYAVSVLSGHMGGADFLAQRVASALAAEAVVTSGSHATETLAVDLLGQEFGWTLEADSTTVTRASAAVVNRDPVGVYQDSGEPGWWPQGLELPANITLHDSLESLARSGCSAALVISDRLDPFLESGPALSEALPGAHLVLYRPRSLVAGMGCRRGVPVEELKSLLLEALHANNLSVASLACVASASIKRDEQGLIELAEEYGVPFLSYTAEELNAVFDFGAVDAPGGQTVPELCGELPIAVSSKSGGQCLHPSANARRLVGVWGVAEPAALLASGAGRLLVPKQTSRRATVAVARMDFAARTVQPIEAGQINSSEDRASE